MTGKEAVRRILEAEDIGYLFGNPGSTEIPLLDAFASAPSIDFILTLHEGIAVAMADGYARASGKPGVVSVHACPGTAQTLGLLYNAWRDGTPLVILAGQQDSRLIIREPFLSADLVRLAEQFTKWSWQVSRIEELPIALRRAFKEATTTPTGPVFLSLPKNVLEETTEVDIVPASKYHVCGEVRGDAGAVRRAAELLVNAKAPVFIAGAGVAHSGGVPELVELTEMLAARVYGDPAAFPTGSPYWFGSFERRQLASIIKSSDVLLVVGHQMFSEFNYSAVPLLPAEVKAIHIDENPWEVAKNVSLDVGIVADSKAGLRDLIDEVKRLSVGKAAGTFAQASARRLAEVRSAQEERRARLEKEASGWGNYPLHIGKVVRELRKMLSEDAIIVDQAIHSSAYLKNYFEFSQPGTYYGEHGGTLGWVIGAALGIKLALPQRQVIAFAGDGATMFAPQALWTAAQRNIAVLTLVINNGGYVAVKALSMAYGAEWAKQGKFVGADISGIDYVKLSEGLGVSARRIERVEDIRPALGWGLTLGKPAVIEVVVDQSDAGLGWPKIPSGSGGS